MTLERVDTLLRDLQSSWQAGDLARIASFYHPDVVLLPPDMGEPITGRDAVVDSYRQFLDAARLDRFVITDLTSWTFDGLTSETAMAHLNFQITYQLEDERFIDTGLEVYTLVAGTEGPLIVWRSQTVLDSRLEAKSEPG